MPNMIPFNLKIFCLLRCIYSKRTWIYLREMQWCGYASATRKPSWLRMQQESNKVSSTTAFIFRLQVMIFLSCIGFVLIIPYYGIDFLMNILRSRFGRCFDVKLALPKPEVIMQKVGMEVEMKASLPKDINYPRLEFDPPKIWYFRYFT